MVHRGNLGVVRRRVFVPQSAALSNTSRSMICSRNIATAARSLVATLQQRRRTPHKGRCAEAATTRRVRAASIARVTHVAARWHRLQRVVSFRKRCAEAASDAGRPGAALGSTQRTRSATSRSGCSPSTSPREGGAADSPLPLLLFEARCAGANRRLRAEGVLGRVLRAGDGSTHGSTQSRG